MREKELKRIFAVSNLKRVWRVKVRISLKSSYIQDPIDALDFHVGLDANCSRIQSAVCDGSYKPTSKTRILAEKSKGLCRQIAIPNIDDAIVLQVLSDALYEVIKDKAPTAKSFFAPEDHRFSQALKFAFGAPRYGSLRAWLEFQKSILKFAKTRRYVIVTDIANYYDFISYAHLRNTIVRLGITSETALDMLIFTLAGMLWQPDYMPRVELGLPQMNLDAPRMLAHCFLYELDEFIEEAKKYDFARFMDDIDIGADSIADAKSILRDVDLVLQTRQVRLNSGKTKILTQREALAHFCIVPNAKIDILAKAIDTKVGSTRPLNRERSFAAGTYRQFVRKGTFDEGNGDKILKRILKLCGRLNVDLPIDHLSGYLRDRPSVRSNVLDYLTEKALTRQRLEVFKKFVCAPTVVDDISYLEAAYAINECAVRRDFGADAMIGEIVRDIAGKGMAAFYAALWLLSKHSDADSLLGFLRDHFEVWRADADIGRLVGGLFPIMLGAGSHESLESLISRARNAGAMQTLAFHRGITSDRKSVAAIRPFVKSLNPSKALQITHTKLLLLLSVVQNTNVPNAERASYLQVHRAAWADIYYRRQVLRLPLPQTLRRLI